MPGKFLKTTKNAARLAVLVAVALQLSLTSGSVKAAGTTDGTVEDEQQITVGVGGFAGPVAIGSRFGEEVTSLGDLDGDGVPDLAVGAPNSDALWILFMDADGTVSSSVKIAASDVGATSGTFFGKPESIGDLNGDGVVDLVVGASTDDTGGFNLGAVFVVFLNSNGTVKSAQKIAHGVGGFPTGVLDPGDQFGQSLAKIGDLDGDGVVDIAASACFDDDGGSNSGAIWILFMNSDGTVKAQQKISATSGGLTPLHANAVLGCGAVGGIGNLNNSGGLDIIASFTPKDDFSGDPDFSGAALVLFLDTNGTVVGQQEISATAGGFAGPLGLEDRFGFSFANMGDLDGDSVIDLVVGAVGDDDGGPFRGAVWVLFMNPNGTVKASQKISDLEGNFMGGLMDHDRFGTGASHAGDLNGDGMPEVAVGAVEILGTSPFTPTGPGSVWILFLHRTTQTLSCDGFEAPMNKLVTVKKNRALPLKAFLINEDGFEVTEFDIAVRPVVQVLFSSIGGGEPVDVTADSLPAGQSSEGNIFSFDPASVKWSYNLATKNYDAPGTYAISMVSGDEGEYTIDPTCQAHFVIE